MTQTQAILASSASGPKWFQDAISAAYDERTIEVRGCRVHYLRWGTPGHPGVVLVHGGAAHAHWWSFIAPLLTRDCQVVALDLSGHGDSGRRSEYPRDIWAEEVMAVADDSGIVGPPIVVGHSMGGFVTIATAARYGDRLAGAVILDSPVRRPNPEEEEGARGKAFRNPKLYPDIETALAHYRLVPDQPWVNPFLIDYIARRCTPCPAATPGSSIRWCSGASRRARSTRCCPRCAAAWRSSAPSSACSRPTSATTCTSCSTATRR